MVAASEPEYTTWYGSSRLVMIASSACEYDGSVPRKRPLSPVSAVANALATSGSWKPSHVASSGYSSST